MRTVVRPEADLFEEEAPRRRNRRARGANASKKTKAKTWHKVVLSVGIVLTVLSGGSLIALTLVTNHYEGLVGKEDILGGIPQAQGKGPVPLNFLILGTDTREGEATSPLDEEGNRSDVIMIVHVSTDRKSAFIFSIPRDSYVNIPKSGSWKGGPNKINAAMAFGGANLAAKTVYDLTKIPLTGAAIINFQGIRNMVDAVGGVDICIPYTVKSFFSDKVWNKGCHHLNAADAEEFSRQRYFTPGGDLGRIKNQQHVIKGIIAKVKKDNMLTDPKKLNLLVTTAAKSLTVDKSTNLMDLALQVKDIDQEAIKFATTPVIGTFMTDAGSSVKLDDAGAQELFTAVREDKTEAWLAAHPQPEVASIS